MEDRLSFLVAWGSALSGNALRMGLELTETYVWLYSERLNWYTGKAVTEPYLSAVANAQSLPQEGSHFKFDQVVGPIL